MEMCPNWKTNCIAGSATSLRDKPAKREMNKFKHNAKRANEHMKKGFIHYIKRQINYGQ